MALFLNIVQGPLTGDKYEIFKGLQLGRTKGQIRLDDAKASSLHAQIEVIDDQFVLIDNNSKNGIRQGKERVFSLVLKPGVEFQIGESHFVVGSDEPEEPVAPEEALKSEEPVAETESQATKITDESLISPDEEVTPPPRLKSDIGQQTSSVADELLQSGEVEEITRFEGEQTSVPIEAPEVERRTWNDRLREWTKRSADKLLDQPKPLAPFEQTLQLTFLRGLQAETSWTLGYGPRQIGPRSLDLPIYEPGAPDPCFEVLPLAGGGVQFSTPYPNDVLLNNKSVKTGRLNPGDKITIENSVIEVDFLK